MRRQLLEGIDQRERLWKWCRDCRSLFDALPDEKHRNVGFGRAAQRRAESFGARCLVELNDRTRTRCQA